MDLVELRERQISFLKDLPQVKKTLQELEKSRAKFVERYSLENLKVLNLEDYVCGTQKSENFCNWLEGALSGLGSIAFSKPLKFGIYYGVTKIDKERKYRFAKRWGNTSTKAYKSIIEAITTLLESGEINDKSKIIKNPIAPMLKGKILNIYFPDKYLSVFSDAHIDYYLSGFGIHVFEKMHVVDKRQILLDFKNSDLVMAGWSNYEFSYFLYMQLGRPDEKKYLNPLEGFSPIPLPQLSDVNPVFIEKELADLPEEFPKKKRKPGVTDFDKKNKTNARIGNQGEHIVIKMEKMILKNAGRLDLADKVTQVSKEDDSAGYDIASFLIDGTPIKIEVKSTQRKPTFANFFISINELNKSKELEEYYLYLVFEANTSSPKILRLKKPFDEPSDKIKIEPISFSVKINLK